MSKHFKTIKLFIPKHLLLTFLISLVIGCFLSKYGGEEIKNNLGFNILITLILSPMVYFFVYYIVDTTFDILKKMYLKYSLYNCFYSIKTIEGFENCVNQLIRFYNRPDFSIPYSKDVYYSILDSKEYKKVKQDILILGNKEFNTIFKDLIIDNNTAYLEKLKEFEGFIVFKKMGKLIINIK